MNGTLGAVIAGGRSVRYGQPKALVPVGGRRVINRAIDSLHEVVDDVVLIANDVVIADAVALPARPDSVTEAGALGGILTALQWAVERGEGSVLAVACDMPFLSPALLRCLVARHEMEDSPDVVVPESAGPRGIEPLCALYSVRCVPAIETSLARDDRRLVGFHESVRVARLDSALVRRFGDPAKLFLNINTPEDREAAERMAGGRST